MTKAIEMGSIVVGVEMRGKMTRTCITDVLHVSKLQANLFRVSKFLLKGLKMQFHVNECIEEGANADVKEIYTK